MQIALFPSSRAAARGRSRAGGCLSAMRGQVPPCCKFQTMRPSSNCEVLNRLHLPSLDRGGAAPQRGSARWEAGGDGTAKRFKLWIYSHTYTSRSTCFHLPHPFRPIAHRCSHRTPSHCHPPGPPLSRTSAAVARGVRWVRENSGGRNAEGEAPDGRLETCDTVLSLLSTSDRSFLAVRSLSLLYSGQLGPCSLDEGHTQLMLPLLQLGKGRGIPKQDFCLGTS
mmetsp:Transcript_25620/g.65139  ORF Transcript_25620/g.65139 Transcript_25620/m.65139 type:complete len:224 (-) Transcript_25620:93-764(-)